jgi:hypothetical protein
VPAAHASTLEHGLGGPKLSWGSPVKALPGQRAPPLLAARASSLERVCAPTTGSGSYKALCVKFSDCRGRAAGSRTGGRLANLRPGTPRPPASSTCLLRRSTEWATPTRGGPAEPIPGTTPHLALEQETGGPKLSWGSPARALPGQRARAPVLAARASSLEHGWRPQFELGVAR